MAPAELVLLFDVDNTLVDNDTAQEQLHDHLARQFGEEAARRYWVLYEEQRQAEGFAASVLVGGAAASSFWWAGGDSSVHVSAVTTERAVGVVLRGSW